MIFIKNRFQKAALLLLTLIATACGTAPTKHESPHAINPHATPGQKAEVPQKSQKGLASWYGKQFRGRKTASGERFDPKLLTAAHRTLPLGTQVQVSCPKTGKSVIVTINDRGPFSPRRIIDLSYAAAKRLGIISDGVALVQVSPLPALQIN